MLIVNEKNGKPIRFLKFTAEFQDDYELLPVTIDIGDCVFPEVGRYVFEVYLSARGSEALKGEHPLNVVVEEE